MKILDKIILTIYSLIMFVESIVIIFLIFGWLHIENMVYIVKDILNNYVVYNTIFAICVLFILMSIKALFFANSNKESNKNNKMGEGILLENENGKLLISKETIERITNSTVKTCEEIQDVKTKIFIDYSNAIKIFIELQIFQNTDIKELSGKLQLQIKENIKKITDLEVEQVNIKVKNIINVPVSIDIEKKEQ
jgi:uncharacterized alkaline shock family protein YloU